MDTFYILNDVILERSDIYQLESFMLKKVFLFSKTVRAPVWIDSKNCSSNFYFVTLSVKSDWSRKNGERKHAYWTPQKLKYAE